MEPAGCADSYVANPGKFCLGSRYGLSHFPVKPVSRPGNRLSRIPVFPVSNPGSATSTTTRGSAEGVR